MAKKPPTLSQERLAELCLKGGSFTLEEVESALKELYRSRKENAELREELEFYKKCAEKLSDNP